MGQSHRKYIIQSKNRYRRREFVWLSGTMGIFPFYSKLSLLSNNNKEIFLHNAKQLNATLNQEFITPQGKVVINGIKARCKEMKADIAVVTQDEVSKGDVLSARNLSRLAAEIFFDFMVSLQKCKKNVSPQCQMKT